MSEKFEKWESEKDGLWYFHLKAPNGEVIATSEGYTSEQNCDDGINSVKRFAKTANILHKKGD